MSTHDLPTEPEWLVTSRKAAYCARQRLNGADLSLQDMEDMIQAAYGVGGIYPTDQPCWYPAGIP